MGNEDEFVTRPEICYASVAQIDLDKTGELGTS
jgi:hypothetical protein